MDAKLGKPLDYILTMCSLERNTGTPKITAAGGVATPGKQTTALFFFLRHLWAGLLLHHESQHVASKPPTSS